MNVHHPAIVVVSDRPIDSVQLRELPAIREEMGAIVHELVGRGEAL